MKQPYLYLLAVVFTMITALLPSIVKSSDTAANSRVRILMLPFTSLETGDASKLLTTDLFQILWDSFGAEPQIELVGDRKNPPSEASLTDEELQSEGEKSNVNWVIAGELQGDPNGWELFLRVMDPQNGIARPSSIQGDNPYQIANSVETWFKNQREFLLITDSLGRAQKKQELAQSSALEYYKTARKMTANDPETLNKKIALFQKAIDIDPGFISAYLSLGLAYQKLENYSAALDAYNVILEINPNYHQAYYNIGTAYQDLQDRKKAAKAYAKAIELHPRYREAWYNLAYVLKYNDDNREYGEGFDADSVEHCLRKLLEIDPNFLQTYIALGIFYQKVGKYQESETLYLEAIRRNKDYEFAWYNLALLYDNFIENYPQAIECYEKYIDLGGQRAEGARNRIEFLQNKIAEQENLKNTQQNSSPNSP